MFCNADKCNINCPAYIIIEDEDTCCLLINAKLKTEQIKQDAIKLGNKSFCY